MSKIEKALKKAQVAGAQRPTSSASEASARNALVPTRHSREPVQATARDSAALAIARMQESFLLVPDELAKRGIIHPEMPEAGAVKAFREVRTKVIQQSKGRNSVVMVVAPVPDPQTSLFSLNLAASFALDTGRTAVAVDCDVKRRALSSILEVANVRGLSDYLVEDHCDIASVVQRVGIQRIRVVPAGMHPNLNTEAFSTERMKQLVDDIYSRYPDRHVILDAPPLTVSADTQILAELCDYILVVVPYGRITLSGIAESIKNLDPKKVVGFVLNGEPSLPQSRVFPERLPIPDWIDSAKSWLARFTSRFSRTSPSGPSAR